MATTSESDITGAAPPTSGSDVTAAARHPSFQFKSGSCIANPNADPWGGIAATFRDRSQVTIVSRGADDEGRQRYAYSLTQEPIPRTVAAGHDLRSGVGEPVNYRKALSAWVSFASADAETYRADMSGDAMQEWAYQHDDELSELAMDLEDQAGSASGIDGSAAVNGHDDTDGM